MKFKIKSIIEVVIVLMMIIECNSIYTRIGEVSNYLDYIFYFVSIVLLVLIIIQIKGDKFKINKKNFRLLIILYIALFLFFILNVRVKNLDYFVKYLIFFPSILFYILYDNDNCYSIINKFTKCVLILSVVSVFLYLLGSLTHIIPSTQLSIRWGSIKTVNSYLNIHFDTQTQNLFGIQVVRNSSIFCEAPMYVFILVLGFLFEILYSKGSKKLYNLIILLITTITTFSATGLIAIVIIIMMYFVFIDINSKRDSLIRFAKIMLIPIVVFSSIYLINFFINYKINSHYNSYFVRIDDYKSEYMAWKNNIILGNGYRDDRLTLKYMDSYRKENIGQSNSTGSLLAECGLWLTVLYYFPLFILLFRSIKKKEYRILVFCIAIIVLLSNTLVTYKYITLFIIALLYKYYLKGDLKINNCSKQLK